MITIKKKYIAGAFVILALVFLFGSHQADAKIYGINGPTFSLRAMKGNIIADDGKSIFMWGFANASGAESTIPVPWSYTDCESGTVCNREPD